MNYLWFLCVLITPTGYWTGSKAYQKEFMNFNIKVFLPWWDDFLFFYGKCLGVMIILINVSFSDLLIYRLFLGELPF